MPFSLSWRGVGHELRLLNLVAGPSETCLCSCGFSQRHFLFVFLTFWTQSNGLGICGSLIICFILVCTFVLNYSVNTFRLIEKSISLAYDIVRQTHPQILGSPSRSGADNMDTTSSSVSSSFIDLPKELFQMLATVGPHLYRDTLLLQKVFF